MNRALLVEFYKTRHRSNLWIIAALLAGQILWSAWSLTYMDSEDLKQGWLYFLYQFQLLDSLMMPLIAAVVMSRLCDIEHKGSAFRLLNTLLPAGRLFDVKFLSGSFYLVAAALLQVLVIFCAGTLRGFAGAVPWRLLTAYFFVTTAVNLTLLVLQQTLSLLKGNQMPAFIVGLIGAFFGLFSLYFPVGLQKIAPWGYYGVLMFIRMDWNRDTRVTHFYQSSLDWGGLAALVMMFILIYTLGRCLFVRKEQ